jgi:hypothetical protein
MSNLEQSMIAYCDRQELGRLVPYFNPETGVIGIELPFDITVDFSEPAFESSQFHVAKLRYIGRIDGLMYDGDRLEVHENKTAARLDNSWSDSFLMSHQVTGYCLAASTVVGVGINNAVVHGLMVPLPKTYDNGGVVRLPIDRDHHRYNEWYKWLYTTYEMYDRWKDDPLNAPEYTHSCNRYFRTCSFLPLCAMADPEDRKLNYSEMITDQWSPLFERNE